MKIFAFLILVLFADLTMGDDIYMCPTTNMNTQGYHEVKTDFADADDFYLGVKACGEVLVSIEFPQNKNAVELVIKNNFLLRNLVGEVLAESDEVVLDCDKMNYYWLNKANGVLTIGRGLQSATDTLMTYPLPSELNWGRVMFGYFGNDVPEFEKQFKRPCGYPTRNDCTGIAPMYIIALGVNRNKNATNSTQSAAKTSTIK
ncbi:hypothetical protein CAPTEDRAFT_209426 [Capitella teleta]|uniref:Farnesoic acid O-methyl transferase domain-containing protein n=1 Tax=Capitella teleta TaxID=283909 RepID=R7V5S3_CAPTE|nr:hypothetical protein CAPTEDRAFT_209426 [Capitella teleta]|eukprot:ELU11130.1 hypothetical protein CAPTEDRAFT_209426 [Capitella teleta]